MNSYVTAKIIKELREKKGYTQKELADKLMLSDKTISKWETGKGLPDISLLEPTAKVLGVSVSELITGVYNENNNKSANLKKSKFYVCPVCGNIISSIGQGNFSCCGITLPVLEEESCDEKHNINVEQIESEYLISVNHHMTKEHYISFIAYVTCDRIQIVKLYPEQNAECRFQRIGHGKIYVYCNRHGLFMKQI